jgi:hypothetical protein
MFAAVDRQVDKDLQPPIGIALSSETLKRLVPSASLAALRKRMIHVFEFCDHDQQLQSPGGRAQGSVRSASSFRTGARQNARVGGREDVDDPGAEDLFEQHPADLLSVAQTKVRLVVDRYRDRKGWRTHSGRQLADAIHAEARNLALGSIEPADVRLGRVVWWRAQEGGQRGSLDTHARRGLDPPGTRAKPKTATKTVCGMEGTRNRQTSSCSCGQRRWATDHQCIHDEETLPRLKLAEVVDRKRGLHERHEDLRSLRKRCTPRARVVSVMLRRPRETAVDALGRTCRRLRSGLRARTACTRRR